MKLFAFILLFFATEAIAQIYPQGSGFIIDSSGANPAYRRAARVLVFSKGTNGVYAKFADGSVIRLDSAGGGGFTGWKRSGGTLRSDTLIVKDSLAAATLARGDTLVIYTTYNWRVSGGTANFAREVFASKDAFTHFTASGDTVYLAIDTTKIIKAQMGVYRAYIGLNGSSGVATQTVLENTTTLTPNFTRIAAGTYKAQLGGTFNPIFTYGFANQHYGFATNGGVELVANVGFSGSGGPNSFDCIVTLENTTTGVPVDPGQITFPVEFYYVIH